MFLSPFCQSSFSARIAKAKIKLVKGITIGALIALYLNGLLFAPLTLLAAQRANPEKNNAEAQLSAKYKPAPLTAKPGEGVPRPSPGNLPPKLLLKQNFAPQWLPQQAAAPRMW